MWTGPNTLEYVDTHWLPTGYLRPKELDKSDSDFAVVGCDYPGKCCWGRNWCWAHWWGGGQPPGWAAYPRWEDPDSGTNYRLTGCQPVPSATRCWRCFIHFKPCPKQLIWVTALGFGQACLLEIIAPLYCNELYLLVLMLRDIVQITEFSESIWYGQNWNNHYFLHIYKHQIIPRWVVSDCNVHTLNYLFSEIIMFLVQKLTISATMACCSGNNLKLHLFRTSEHSSGPGLQSHKSWGKWWRQCQLDRTRNKGHRPRIDNSSTGNKDYNQHGQHWRYKRFSLLNKELVCKNDQQ